MKRFRNVVASLAMGLAIGSAAAEGLRPVDDDAVQPAVWPQWQARHAILAMPAAPLSLWTPNSAEASHAGQLSLVVGDYLFARPGLSWWPRDGVLRASTGLVVSSRNGPGLRSPDPSSPGNSALPYLGVGYAGLAAKGGWSFSADLGLVAENPGTLVSTGRALLGSQSLDSALREMRFSPLFQVGVRYAF